MLIELLDKEMFMTQYQRNNKAKAKKNLRCFPACRHEGHVPAGFCGRAIRVKVTYSPDELDVIGSTGIAAFGVFRPVDCPPQMLLTGAFPRAGDMLSIEEVVCRSFGPKRLEFEGGWFTSVLTESKETPDAGGKVAKEQIFSVNENKSNWPYAWKSHRMTSTTKHCVHLFVLAASELSSTCVCVGDIQTPSFSLYCRRECALDTKRVADTDTARTSLEVTMPKLLERMAQVLASDCSSLPMFSVPAMAMPHPRAMFGVGMAAQPQHYQYGAAQAAAAAAAATATATAAAAMMAGNAHAAATAFAAAGAVGLAQLSQAPAVKVTSVPPHLEDLLAAAGGQRSHGAQPAAAAREKTKTERAAKPIARGSAVRMGAPIRMD